jgi:hypothetical protein
LENGINYELEQISNLNNFELNNFPIGTNFRIGTNFEIGTNFKNEQISKLEQILNWNTF